MSVQALMLLKGKFERKAFQPNVETRLGASGLLSKIGDSRNPPPLHLPFRNSSYILPCKIFFEEFIIAGNGDHSCIVGTILEFGNV
jgi:hypothetical protein